ncbi:MAG: DUF2219 family protein [Oceanicaulis sp.]
MEHKPQSFSSQTTRPAWLFAGAAMAAGLSCAPAFAQVDDSGVTPSEQVRTMILGPLYEEFDRAAPRQPGARLVGASMAATLRFTARPSAVADAASPRPAAARFADAVMVARIESPARDRLAAFSGGDATLAYSPTAGRVSVSLFDGGAPDAAFLGFRPDYAESAGRALRQERDRPRRMALRYERSFDATGSDGLDYGLAPRAGVSVGGEGAALETGATVRLGQYINTEFDRPAWWFFAGADRQAVMYDPGQGFDMRGALAMEPYAIVGDAQAGVAMRVGGTDLSFAYIHRETEYSMPQESWDTREGFAAFSLTWRR